MNFPYGALSVRRVMQHAVRIDQIERLVCEIQILRVGGAKPSSEPEQLETPARQLNRRLRQINARIIGPGARKLRPIRPQPATYLQHAQATRRIETRRLRYMPLLRIAMLFDTLKEKARPRRSIRKLRPARIRLPEGTHALFQCRTGFNHKTEP